MLEILRRLLDVNTLSSDLIDGLFDIIEKPKTHNGRSTDLLFTNRALAFVRALKDILLTFETDRVPIGTDDQGEPNSIVEVLETELTLKAERLSDKC